MQIMYIRKYFQAIIWIIIVDGDPWRLFLSALSFRPGCLSSLSSYDAGGLECDKVFKASKDQRAETLPKSALDMLQEQVSKIEYADLRYSFLNNARVNWRILSESEMGGVA